MCSAGGKEHAFHLVVPLVVSPSVRLSGEAERACEEERESYDWEDPWRKEGGTTASQPGLQMKLWGRGGERLWLCVYKYFSWKAYK